MSWAAVRVGVLKRKQRPSIPKNLYDKCHDYVDLIKECWDQDPARRPTLSVILKRLEQISYRLSLQVTTHPPPTGEKVSIVFSDIQNSAFLWENCPNEMKEAMTMHNEIIRDAFREFGGYEVRSDGDSFMIAFSSAKNACSFSVKVTETLLQIQWNPELMAWLEDEGRMTGEEGYEDVVFKGVRVRMGIHYDVCEFTRDPVTDRVDYTGPTAIKAARLSLTAPGGQILVSSSFRNEIARDLHTISNPPPELLPVGTVYIKGFPDPELVYQLLAPSLVGRHKKYMAQPANQSAIIWQDQMNSLDSMFPGSNTPVNNRTIRNVTLSAYPQDLARPNTCPPARFTASNLLPPRAATPSPSINNRASTLSISPPSTARATAHPLPLNSRGIPNPQMVNHAILTPTTHDPFANLKHPSAPSPTPNADTNLLPNNLTPKLSRGGSIPQAPPSPTLNPPSANTPGRLKTPRNIEGNTFTIDFNEISLGEEIGRGSYGVVSKGKWRGQQVAVKRLLRGKIKQELLTEFYNEVQIMCNLRCPHLILFMGACFKPPNLCIVTELMPRNLYQVLHDSRITITGWMRLRWAKHIALGMNYLHKLNLIHRDLKSNNLLVDSSYNVKITDFGFARVKTTNQTMTKCGTVNWIAPEIAEGNTYTEKSDVYSYAITLYEILTRKVPFGNESANEVLEKVLVGKRPDLPVVCPAKFVQLMMTCWEQDYNKRPSFEDILNSLETWTDSDCDCE